MQSHAAKVLVALLALLLPVCATCSVADNYELLSFFFDGVPDPSKAPEPEPFGPPVPPEIARQFRQTGLQEEVGSNHAPFRQDRCDACHEGEKPSAARGYAMDIGPVIAPLRELCFRCHGVLPTVRYVHGPVAAGACSVCHQAHFSEFRHLLRAEHSKELCASCHRGATFATADEHEPYGDRDCADCHDPHASARRYLLRPEAGAVDGGIWRPVEER